MYISQCYKYKKDGIVYVGGNDTPDEVEILETMDILNSEEGYNLIRISDEENMGSSLWLREGDAKENYREEKQEGFPVKKEKDNG